MQSKNCLDHKHYLDIDNKLVIYVSKYQTTFNNDDHRLRMAFSVFGPIKSFNVLENQKGEKIGYIEYESHVDAQKATKQSMYEGGAKVGLLTGWEDSLCALSVTNLPKEYCNQWDECRVIFERFGKLTFFTVIEENENAFCLLKYETPLEANRAISEMDGKKICGQCVSVTYQRNETHREAYLVALRGGLVEKPICIGNAHYLYNVEPSSSSSTFSRGVTSQAGPSNTRCGPNVINTTFQNREPAAFRNLIPPRTVQLNSGQIIQDQMLLRTILSAKVEGECKKYADTLVNNMMHHSTFELNTLIKNDVSLKNMIKEKLLNVILN